MQATQTRSQGRAFGQRAIIAIAFLVAAVLITLSTLYLATGRTASSAHAAPSRVHAVSGRAAAAPSVKTDTQDVAQGGNAAQPAVRNNGPLP